MKICIIDADGGNKMSVYNILKHLNIEVKISRSRKDLSDATHLILPGVGSYSNLMNNLKKHNLVDLLSEEVLIKKKKFLGICVGMQVLSTFGNEYCKTPGLNWIEGIVRKIDSKDLRLPHIGWNNLSFSKNHFIAKDIREDLNFYFLHSFVFETKNINSVIATTEYGETLPSIVNFDNIWGFQFHPEKSQYAGQVILRNFLNL
jgi:glutamine amidotransferase